MEARDNLKQAITQFSSAEIDWSLSAGPIWLVIFGAIFSIGFVVFSLNEKK